MAEAAAKEDIVKRTTTMPVTVAVARRASVEQLEVEIRQSLSTTRTSASSLENDCRGGHSNRCGYGKWRPNFLQCINSPNVLAFFLASYSFALGFLVNGVHNVNVSTIERRFGLSSTSMGLVSSSFDISAATLALIIGYYGSGRKKPRLLATCMLVSAVGSFIMASPHFLTGPYSLGSATEQMLCGAGRVRAAGGGGGDSAGGSSLMLSSMSGSSRLPDGGLGTSLDNRTLAGRVASGGRNDDGADDDLDISRLLDLSSCAQKRLDGTTAEESKLPYFWFLFLLAQLLHGVGGTALFTVGASLIDDSVEARRTPLLLGLVYGSNILGSGCGYILGGQFLRIYVDWEVFGGDEDKTPAGLTPEDTRWVGAWWIGPSLAAVFQLLLSFPMSLYGSELPHAQEVRRTRVNQAHVSTAPTNTDSTTMAGGKKKRGRALTQTLEILSNPCFTFVMLAMTTEAMFMSGSAAFLPKIVENEFGLPASEAAVFSGLAVIPAACFGLILGGYLAKRFNFTIRDTIKFIMAFCFLGAVSCSVLWIRCDPPDMYGIHVPYRGSGSSITNKPVSLQDTCNSLCSCETNIYEPVCSEEAGIFFSPCFAGCTTKVGNEYFGCACVSLNHTGKGNSSLPKGGKLSTENCRESCLLLYAFVPLLCLGMCCTFMPIAPCDSLQLRCVPEDHKVYAQGIKTLVVRLLGSFVGPIMMGKLVDLSCWVWREDCGARLSCWIYNPDELVLAVFLYTTLLKLLSFLSSSLALKFYRPPPSATPTTVAVKSGGDKEGGGADKGASVEPLKDSNQHAYTAEEDSEQMLETAFGSNTEEASSKDTFL